MNRYNNLRVGDLVEIARRLPCCGKPSKHQGELFIIAGFATLKRFRCRLCGARGAYLRALSTGQIAAEVSRLRKVPPLHEPEATETKHEVPA